MVQLYEQHAAAVLSFVRRYSPDEQSAEDLVQETFLRAWRRLSVLDDTKNTRAYLMTTARNLATDQWRKHHDTTGAGVEGLELTSASADDIDAAMTAILVGEALQRITDDHRAVVQLLFYDGWSVLETAALLGIPAGTVKSRSYYALRALRAALDELGATR